MKLEDIEESKEGKLLLSSIAILSTSEFTYYGEKIDGRKLTPFDILDMIVELSDEIKQDGSIDILSREVPYKARKEFLEILRNNIFLFGKKD